MGLPSLVRGHTFSPLVSSDYALPSTTAMVFSKVWSSSHPHRDRLPTRPRADYYTSYPLFKDASGVAIAAIGTLSTAVQFGEACSIFQ